MDLHDNAIIFSLALTFLGYSLAFEVLRLWSSAAMRAFKPHDRKPFSWLLMASTVVITLGVLDSGYWSIPWGMDLFDYESAREWFHRGIYLNIPFRQMALITVCYFHLRGIFDYSPDKKSASAKLKSILKRSALIGAVSWATLFGLKALQMAQ